MCKSRQHRVLDSRTHTIRKKERGRGGWSSDGKAIYWKASQPEGEGEKKKKHPSLWTLKEEEENRVKCDITFSPFSVPFRPFLHESSLTFQKAPFQVEAASCLLISLH